MQILSYIDDLFNRKARCVEQLKILEKENSQKILHDFFAKNNFQHEKLNNCDIYDYHDPVESNPAKLTYMVKVRIYNDKYKFVKSRNVEISLTHSRMVITQQEFEKYAKRQYANFFVLINELLRENK